MNDLFKTRYQMLYSLGSNLFKTMPADSGHLAIFIDLFYIFFKLRMHFRLVCFSLQNTIFLWDYMYPKSWIVHDDIENWNLYDFLPHPPLPRKFRSFGKSLNSYNPDRRPAASGGPLWKKYLSSYIFKQIFYIVVMFKVDFIRLNILRTRSVIVVGFQQQLDVSRSTWFPRAQLLDRDRRPL